MHAPCATTLHDRVAQPPWPWVVAFEEQHLPHQLLQAVRERVSVS